MFGEFDKIAKLDVFLYNPNFDIGVANAKKTFNEFFARFTLIITPLDFIDCHKISNL